MDDFSIGNVKDLEHLHWKTGERKLAWKGPIFDIYSVQREATDGREGTFIEVHSPTWVTVIPWFRDSQGIARFVMVQQYRHGSDSITREFPAGLVDVGEQPVEAATRELLEETGCSAEHMVCLGDVSPNSAFMDNRAHFFLAEGLSHVQAQQLDANEQLDVLTVPVEEVVCDMGIGLYDNGIMMMALGFFLKEGSKRSQLLA